MRRSISSSGTLPSTTRCGEPFHDGRLSHAGFAQQHGVVLRTAAEDLHRAFDLFFAADHRVQLALPGQLRQVAAEAIQRGRFRLAGALAFAGRTAGQSALPLGTFGPFHAVAQQIQHLLADLFQFQAEIHQHLGGHAFLLAQQTEENVLRAHVVVVEIPRLFHRILDDFLGPRGLRQLAHGDHVGTTLHKLFDFEPDLAEIDVEILQHVRRDAAALLDQTQQDVFGADILMVKPLCLLIGQLHDLPGTVGESFVHCRSPWDVCVRY